MIAALTYLKTAFGHFVTDDRGQDAFEYLLVVGGISVAVIFAMISPVGDTLINSVIDGTCAVINTKAVPVTCT